MKKGEKISDQEPAGQGRLAGEQKRASLGSLRRSLRLAAGRGNVRRTREILEGVGADKLGETELGWALDEAAENGHEACVELLMGLAGASAREEALMRAAQGGRQGCVRMLIPTGNPLKMGSKALRLAARGGHAGCVEALLPLSDAGAEQYEALTLAAAHGHQECLALLLAHGAPRERLQEALWLACGHGETACAQSLALASVDVAAENFKALRLAAQGGHVECAQWLIENYPPTSEAAGAALRLAAMRGHEECARILLGKNGIWRLDKPITSPAGAKQLPGGKMKRQSKAWPEPTQTYANSRSSAA
jgi:hypothetical protein